MVENKNKKKTETLQFISTLVINRVSESWKTVHYHTSITEIILACSAYLKIINKIEVNNASDSAKTILFYIPYNH